MILRTKLIGILDELAKFRQELDDAGYDNSNVTNAIIELRHMMKSLKEEPVRSSRKPIKSDFDDNGNWVDDEKPVKKEDMHGSFRKLSKEEHDKLKPQVEEELDKWMSKKHFGLDKEVYDETVEYIISLFGEDNYAPKDVKEAVSSWYNDTLDSFPEMLKGKGDKRKIASAAYLKQIKSSHCIKSSREPIKSSVRDDFARGLQNIMKEKNAEFAYGTLEDNMVDIYDNYVSQYYEEELKEEGGEAVAEDWFRNTYPDDENGIFIHNSRKPIKSSTYQFVCEFDGQYQPRVIDYMYKAGSPAWTDWNEDGSNGKQFSEEEMPKIAKQLEKFYSENAQGGMSDIEIVKDNGDSVFLEEFLQEGSFDKAWEKAVAEDDKWFED